MPTDHPTIRRALRTIPAIGGLVAIAVTVGQVVRGGISAHEAVGMCAAFLLVVIGSRLTIDASTRLNEGATWSMQAALQLVGLLLFGPWVAIAPAALAALAISLARRRPVRNSLDNATTAALTMLTSAWVFSLLGGTFGHATLPGDYLPFLAAAFVLGAASELYFGVAELGDAENLRLGVRNQMHGLREYVPSAILEALLGMAIAIVYIIEPWATLVLLPLAASLFIAMRRGVRVQQVTEAALESFANIVDERDRYTFEHSTRVCDYSMLIGQHMGLTDAELRSLYWTSRLHDLGKVAVDNAILNKPGKLTDDEYEIMKIHPVVSARILSSFSFDEKDSDVVLCHHERFDGRGYLRREPDSIPLEAFIIAVADTYDAMTSDRPYRKGLASQVALEEIDRNIGSQFHPDCARAFLEAMRYVPTAESRVELDQASGPRGLEAA